MYSTTEMTPVAIDRFRGTTQRWSVDAGPLAGTAYDHAFHDDWSLTWRVVAGDLQGRLGRARQFCVQPVRAHLYLVAFTMTPATTMTATVDFTTRRFVGFLAGPGECQPLSGSFQTL